MAERMIKNAGKKYEVFIKKQVEKQRVREFLVKAREELQRQTELRIAETTLDSNRQKLSI